MAAAIALAASGENIGDAAFPGGNGVISFTGDGTTFWGEYRSNIFTVDSNDTHPEPVILSDTGPISAGTAWSPDGTRLVSGGLLVVDSDGSNQHRIADLTAYHPSWSPDGNRIVFGGSGNALYVIDAEGGEPQKIFEGGADTDDGGASWSPDGSRIAFTQQPSAAFPNGSRIAFIDPTGGNLAIPSALPIGVGPVFSPDGRCIAFSAYAPIGRLSIAIATLDGSSVTVFPGPPDTSNELPAWSPDGRQIAFVRSSNTTQDVYVMDVDGANIRQLTDDPEASQWIDWQPLPGGGEPAPCPIADASKPPVYPATDLPSGGGPPERGSGSRLWVVALAVALTLLGAVLIARARRA